MPQAKRNPVFIPDGGHTQIFWRLPDHRELSQVLALQWRQEVRERGVSVPYTTRRDDSDGEETGSVNWYSVDWDLVAQIRRMGQLSPQVSFQKALILVQVADREERLAKGVHNPGKQRKNSQDLRSALVCQKRRGRHEIYRLRRRSRVSHHWEDRWQIYWIRVSLLKEQGRGLARDRKTQ